MSEEFPLWPNKRGMQGDPDEKRPLENARIAPGIYENLSTLSESEHTDPRADNAAGNYGPPA